MSKLGSRENLKSQVKDMGKNVWTIPNLLSIIRIIIVPFFAYFFINQKYLVAVILIAVSGLTDLFDGKIARRFNQISKLGAVLDPVADKLTQIVLTLLYFHEFQRSDDRALKMFSYVFLLFIVKELLMIVGSLVLLSMDIVPQSAIIYGKAATTAFYVVMAAVMLFAPGFGALSKYLTMPTSLMMILVSITAIMTVVALISYMPASIKSIKLKKASMAEDSDEKKTKEKEE